MSVIIDQIDKAARRLNFDIADRISELQDKTPGEASSDDQKKQRLDFLTRSLGDKQSAVITLERELAGNELQPELLRKERIPPWHRTMSKQ